MKQKQLFKNPKTYFILITVGAVITVGIFFFSQFWIFQNLNDPFDTSIGTSANEKGLESNTPIKNPLEDIVSNTEDSEDTSESTTTDISTSTDNKTMLVVLVHYQKILALL